MRKENFQSKENITINEFVDLLDYLDKNEEGQNLRMYPDGSSYITNDNGIETGCFDNIFELIKFLRDLKSKYESGELIPIER